MNESEMMDRIDKMPVPEMQALMKKLGMDAEGMSKEEMRKKLKAIGSRKPDELSAAVENKSQPAMEVKFIGEGETRIRAPLVLFGDETKTDLSRARDYFTPQTDLMLQEFPLPRPLFFHHGLDAKTNRDPWIGMIDRVGVEEWGAWYEAKLREAKEYETYVAQLMDKTKQLIRSGALKTSIDGIPQYSLRDTKANGANEVKRWAFVAASLTTKPAETRMWAAQELKSIMESNGVQIAMPEDDPETRERGSRHKPENAPTKANLGVIQMDEKELAAFLDKREAETKAYEAKVKAGVDAKLAEMAKQRGNPNLFAAKSNHPFYGFNKYDEMPLADAAFLAMLRTEAKSINKSRGANEDLLKSVARRSLMARDEAEKQAADGVKDPNLTFALKALEDLPAELREMKANEVMQSTLASYGDEWVPSNWSNQLWLAVRAKARLLADNFIPQVEIPRGYESLTLPVESADVTFYNVSQVANEDGTMKTPAATIPSSREGTGQVVITIGKLGARVQVSGELDEDSIVPSIAEVRAKLERQLGPEIDYVLFNTDNTAATDNINGNGTPTTTADYYALGATGLIRNGLKANSAANAYDMGAAISSTKIRANFYSTLGANGFYVWDDASQVRVFSDYVAWSKVLGMSDLLTVANAGDRYATIVQGVNADNGVPIFGVLWLPSGGVKPAQATGVRHGTESNNTLGRAVAVRGDQWKIAWKRRAQFETVRIPRADLTEIVVTLRMGINSFDTEASAVAFNI